MPQTSPLRREYCVHDAKTPGEIIGDLHGGKGLFLVGHGDIAADITLFRQVKQKAAEFIGRYFFFAIASGDTVTLQPVTVN